jgi:putative hydrolase of the HAD superfamily
MNRFRLYPDVKPVMAELGKRGIKTAIVTTGRRFEFEPFLEENGLHFDFISTGRESGAAKPNPRCYLTALEGLGVKAEDALMVGDEPDLDVAAPKQLGMMGILLCRNGKSDYGNADGMISSLSELVRFL